MSAKELSQKLKKEILKSHTRQGRKKADFILCEGLRCCEEVLKSNAVTIRHILVADSFLDSSTELLLQNHSYTICRDSDIKAMACTDSPQGILVIIDKVEFENFSKLDPFTLFLDGIGDPGNLGTIIRTAVAAGLKEIVLRRGGADPFSPKAIRSAMGTQFQVKLVAAESIADFSQKHNFSKTWLTTPHEGESCYSTSFDLSDSLLVIGSEANGIEDFSHGDKCTIPMPGNSESLNVAQAATLFIFEGVRQGLLK